MHSDGKSGAFLSVSTALLLKIPPEPKNFHRKTLQFIPGLD
jgi:hypothetical protein